MFASYAQPPIHKQTTIGKTVAQTAAVLRNAEDKDLNLVRQDEIRSFVESGML